jgi:hypothetical protein
MITYGGRKGRVMVVPLGRLPDVAIDHPERTTTRSAGWDIELREWPSEGAARQAVRMADSGTNPRGLRMIRRPA